MNNNKWTAKRIHEKVFNDFTPRRNCTTFSNFAGFFFRRDSVKRKEKCSITKTKQKQCKSPEGKIVIAIVRLQTFPTYWLIQINACVSFIWLRCLTSSPRNERFSFLFFHHSILINWFAAFVLRRTKNAINVRPIGFRARTHQCRCVLHSVSVLQFSRWFNWKHTLITVHRRLKMEEMRWAHFHWSAEYIRL